MPDFSIKIVPSGGGLAAFQPDLPRAQAGRPAVCTTKRDRHLG